MQHALAEFMSNPANYLQLGEFFQKKRNYFLEQIKRSSFEPLPCSGTYFQILSYKAVSDKTDTVMAEWLTKEHKLASIPVSGFYKDNIQDHLLRFCFAKGDETLQKAGKILNQL